MKKKKILFFPFEVGIAHITRSLSVAEALKKRGHTVAFAIPKANESFIKNAGIQTFDVPASMDETNLDNFTQFRNPEYLKRLAVEDRKIIARFNPDSCVIDLRISALIAAAAEKKPTAHIAHSDVLPIPTYLPTVGMPFFLKGIAITAIQTILMGMKKEYLGAVEKAYEALMGTPPSDMFHKSIHYIIPEPDFYLPAKASGYSLSYVGPLVWNGFEMDVPSWLKNIRPNGKTVYLTFGGTGFDGKKLVALAQTLLDAGYRVIVSASTIAPLDWFPKHDNLFLAKYLPGTEVCKRVDALICHGGYGTLMQAASQGVPVVSLPFHPDQLLHALRFEELGFGKSMIHFQPDFLLKLQGSHLQDFVNVASNIKERKILDTLKGILKNKDRYKEALKNYRNELSGTTSSEKAASVVEQLS